MSGTRIDYSELDALVGRGRDETPAPRRFSLGRLLRALVAWLAVAVLLAVVPFFILVRVGVAAWAGWGLGAWSSLVVGVLAVGVVLGLYSWIADRWMGSGGNARRLLDRGAVAIGLAFVLYGGIWAGASLRPAAEVRDEYRQLHPLLRTATGLVFLADPGRVLPEARPSREDYRLLGLSIVEADRHYVQGDGFVHAVDFRTRGRPEWGNRAVEVGFWLLGFHAYRHRGVADHLHVSIRR